MRYFKLSENETTLKTEALAGLTTFLTMSYIIFVNPSILKETGMPANAALVATVLVAALSSVLMGVIANLPYALAPGMGINAFFTYTLVITQGISWQVALGATFISGIIFILLTILNVRTLIVIAIPKVLRFSIAAGIGLFIAFIGLKNAGVIVSHPATLVTHGKWSPSVIIFFISLAITIFLVVHKFKIALLVGILVGTLLGIVSGNISLPETIIVAPDFSLFGQFAIKEALTLSMVAPIFSMLMTDLFDSIATFLGVAQAANLLDDEEQPKNISKALFVDAIATTGAGIFGSSAGTTYIESVSGIESGGRTGLTAVVTGILFLPFLFLGNLATVVPSYATAPALVIVGIFMCGQLRYIDFENYEDAIPAFLAIILIPLTYSITQGIVWSFISYTTLKITLGKSDELHPMMYVITLLSGLIIFIEYS
ncbi:NCS2 family permease [Candidatus Uabimicrobium sp. HlEnr_7]|uniref:NCS2 family permease n=1 Tax=Candidatus Uabimicrobium helgolandensis TaxID=3095367 RepID=UPI00355830B5